MTRVELRSVDELMDLLHACRGAWDTPDRSGDPVDLHDHALQTAALLRRGHPSDKELQLAGLVHDIGHLLRPGDDAVTLRQADDAGKVVGLDAGVMEDWRPVVELVAQGYRSSNFTPSLRS
ncbi:inositol oxygenase family protein [Streptomyces sp. NPDC056728]